jgi:hypothetical protein
MRTKFCIDCGKPIKNFYAKRCLSCCKKGKLHFNFRKHLSLNTRQKISKSHSGTKSRFYVDGRSLVKNYCINCGKRINWKSIRCPKCSAINNHKINPNRMKGKNNKWFGIHRFGKDNPNWKGGKYIQSSGYVLVYSPKHPNANKTLCVQEHRLVMEKYLGRYLTKKEIVHHKNNIRTDNRLSNLKLFPTQKAHLAYHKMLKERFIKYLLTRVKNLSKELKSKNRVC